MFKKCYPYLKELFGDRISGIAGAPGSSYGRSLPKVPGRQGLVSGHLGQDVRHL